MPFAVLRNGMSPAARDRSNRKTQVLLERIRKHNEASRLRGNDLANYLIARYVMKWEVATMRVSAKGPLSGVRIVGAVAEPIPRFSEDYGAALAAMEGATRLGFCPCLIYDDNGHWAVTNSGIQSVPSGKKRPDEFTAILDVEPSAWSGTPALALFKYLRGIASGIHRGKGKRKARPRGLIAKPPSDTMIETTRKGTP